MTRCPFSSRRLSRRALSGRIAPFVPVGQLGFPEVDRRRSCRLDCTTPLGSGSPRGPHACPDRRDVIIVGTGRSPLSP